MLRGQDILILAGLLGATDARVTIQSVADEVGLDLASVHRGRNHVSTKPG